MDTHTTPPSDSEEPASGAMVIPTLPHIEQRILVPEKPLSRQQDINVVPKIFVDAACLDGSFPLSPRHGHREDRNAEWSQKEKILKSLAATLPACSGDKCRDALKLMCSTIEDVFTSGHEGATDRAITLVAKYFLPGAMSVLRKEGYYEDLKTFVSPEQVKADLAGSAKIAQSKLYADMQFLVHDMHDGTVDGLSPLEIFQQFSGSIYSPNSDAPLKDITQSAAEAYVLVGKGMGWQAAQNAMFGSLQPSVNTRS